MLRPMRSPVVSAGSTNSSTKTITTKTLNVRNWRPRYAAAPSWTAPEISCILGVPAAAASTPARRTKEMIKATIATTPTAMTIVRSPLLSDSVELSAANDMSFIQLLIHCAVRIVGSAPCHSEWTGAGRQTSNAGNPGVSVITVGQAARQS